MSAQTNNLNILLELNNHTNSELVAIRNKDFSKIKIWDLNLKNIIFENCIFSSNNSKTHIYHCEFDSCVFSKCIFEGASTIACKFLNCTLDQNNFNNVIFEDTTLKNTFKNKNTFKHIIIESNVEGIEENYSAQLATCPFLQKWQNTSNEENDAYTFSDNSIPDFELSLVSEPEMENTYRFIVFDSKTNESINSQTFTVDQIFTNNLQSSSDEDEQFSTTVNTNPDLDLKLKQYFNFIIDGAITSYENKIQELKDLKTKI